MSLTSSTWITFYCVYIKFIVVRKSKNWALTINCRRVTIGSWEERQQAQPRQLMACTWRWGAAAPWLVAPLLYPWSERGQSPWRVGWHGSSCWLLCLCVLYFVFCVPTNDQTTVPFCLGRNFFQFCNNWCSYFETTDGYLRFVSTVNQTTVPFFYRVVIFSGCNLNPPKNMAG